MLPSTTNVYIWWIQESLYLKLEALVLWAPGSPLDRVHNENVASIRPQISDNDSTFAILHSLEKSKNLWKDKRLIIKGYIM